MTFAATNPPSLKRIRRMRAYTPSLLGFNFPYVGDDASCKSAPDAKLTRFPCSIKGSRGSISLKVEILATGLASSAAVIDGEDNEIDVACVRSIGFKSAI